MTPAIATLPTDGSGLFDTIAGLPVHPLVVHAAVVLMPLSVIGLLLVVLFRGLRHRYASLVTLGTVVGAIALFVAEQSGESLLKRTSVSHEHTEMGELAAKVGLGVAALTVLWYVLQRMSRRRAAVDGVEHQGVATTIVGALAALAGIGSVVAIVLAGHSGAQSAWADVVTPATGTPSSTATPAPSITSTDSATAGGAAAPTGTATTSGSATATSTATSSTTASGYTLAQVKEHNSASSCWTAIDGTVYDLTAWISQHPGGVGPIEGLCGTDGSAAFTQQHGGQARPARELAQFKLGALAG